MTQEFKEAWLSVPLGVALGHMEDRREGLWRIQGSDPGAAREIERVESLLGSLGRVLAWLATTRPPTAVPGAVRELPVASGRYRARGRVCFKCRGQIRKTAEMVTVCPVWMPGLPVHAECFEGMEREFGGRQ